MASLASSKITTVWLFLPQTFLCIFHFVFLSFYLFFYLFISLIEASLLFLSITMSCDLKLLLILNSYLACSIILYFEYLLESFATWAVKAVHQNSFAFVSPQINLYEISQYHNFNTTAGIIWT